MALGAERLAEIICVSWHVRMASDELSPQPFSLEEPTPPGAIEIRHNTFDGGRFFGVREADSAGHLVLGFVSLLMDVSSELIHSLLT